MPLTKAETEALNKKVVLEFFEKVLIPVDFSLAPPFFGPRYIQHSPLATDGQEGLRAFLEKARVETPHAKDAHQARFRRWRSRDRAQPRDHRARHAGACGRRHHPPRKRQARGALGSFAVRAGTRTNAAFKHDVLVSRPEMPAFAERSQVLQGRCLLRPFMARGWATPLCLYTAKRCSESRIYIRNEREKP